MSTYEYLNTINSSGKSLFTTSDLRGLLGIDSSRTLEAITKRLLEEKILISLERGKYLLANSDVTDFEIAQFLYSPSYISFETALNYHGILSQFPVEITSATTKSSEKKFVQEKTYTYSQLSTDLFIGFEKEGNSLIATAEKALIDQMYMIAKGLKTEEYLDEMDYSNISKAQVQQYVELVSEKLQGTLSDILGRYL